VTDERGDIQAAALPLRCARCVRTPRDPDDRTTWVTIDDERICPGCLTLHERERLRLDDGR
jgi:hypothetical protein